MKYVSSLLLAVMLLFSCQGQVGIKTISPTEFAKGIQDNTVQVLDVRTSDEFDGGFIENARNIDVNSADFSTQILQLKKDAPVYVYCLSGGRSRNAAAILAENGFKEIYNLDGGIMKWKYEGQKIVFANPNAQKNKGMSFDEYKKMLASKNKPVLVEFYATWCVPCKTLKPKVEEIGKEYANDVEVVTIDVDKNKEIADSLRIQSIPLLIYYKNGKQKWSVNDGAISKSSLLKKLKL